MATYNEQATQRDPSRLAWPVTLPIELALKTASPAELKDHYNFTDEEWEALRHTPAFMLELTQACERIRVDGVSFKEKAKLQAEAMLETSWRLVHAPANEVPANVKSDLIKTTFRIAGYDNKDVAAAGQGNALNIQINLGG